jgi:hypothetical protein
MLLQLKLGNEVADDVAIDENANAVANDCCSGIVHMLRQ